MIEPCKVCKRNDMLRPMCYGEDGPWWAHCDSCGNMSTPSTTEHPLTVWNREQKQAAMDGKIDRVEYAIQKHNEAVEVAKEAQK